MFTFLSVIHISFYLPPRVNSSPGTRGNTIFPSSQATTRRGYRPPGKYTNPPAGSLLFRHFSSPRVAAPLRDVPLCDPSYLQPIVLPGLHKQSRINMLADTSFAWIFPFFPRKSGIFVVYFIYSPLEYEGYILRLKEGEEEKAFIGWTRNKYTEMLMIGGEDFRYNGITISSWKF